jgi:carbamoyl-phosphate synthase large subunit
MGQLTVFVTGAGALLGQGILRCLRMSQRPLRLLTGDPDHRAAGHWLGDCAYTIPMAKESNFINQIEQIIAQEKVTFLFIGTDVELSILSRERRRLEDTYGVRTIVSPLHVIEIADDKWLTAQFLKKEGFPFPCSALANDRDAIQNLVDDVGFPLFAKPRRGARSVGAKKIENQDMLNQLYSTQNDYVIQELLPEDQGEYTVGCLVLNGRCKSVVVLRRNLRDGNTYRAYADTSGRFEEQMAVIAERLGVEGPCNFQFRIRGEEPVIFEINARFSGTTPVRAIFGFNEVDALLAYLVDGKSIPSACLKEGAVFKTWSDIFISQDQLELLKTHGRLPNPSSKSFPFLLDGKLK